MSDQRPNPESLDDAVSSAVSGAIGQPVHIERGSDGTAWIQPGPKARGEVWRRQRHREALVALPPSPPHVDADVKAVRAAWVAWVEAFSRCWCGADLEGTATWALEHVECDPRLDTLRERRLGQGSSTPHNAEVVAFDLDKCTVTMRYQNEAAVRATAKGLALVEPRTSDARLMKRLREAAEEIKPLPPIDGPEVSGGLDVEPEEHPAKAKCDHSFDLVYRCADCGLIEDDEPWEDRPLPEDAAIGAVHPGRSGRHDLWAEAHRLVGARHSKERLVSLVNWLLHHRMADVLRKDDEHDRDVDQLYEQVQRIGLALDALAVAAADVIKAWDEGLHDKAIEHWIDRLRELATPHGSPQR